MVSHRISFDEVDMEFIREYKDSHGVSIQSFVETAIKEKIEKINTIDTIKNMELIKK